jgi:UDP-N-acetylmuramyl pentapeptide phosphotransferase/UDP-N-acetylglucosamine-1-phosphate transferase
VTAVHAALAGAIAAAISAALVPVIFRYAERRRIVAVPNERSSHDRVTPVGGGLPVVLCVIVGVLWLRDPSAVGSAWWLAYLAGGAVIAGVSWWDDLRGVAVGVRLIVHASAALFVVLTLDEVIRSGSPVVGIVAAIVWIVGFTNAYNFMDGIDGIAAAQAIVAGAGWTWLALGGADPLVAVVGAIVAGASLGFLFYNWPPARIFMGDVGAAFIGFTFASLTVLGGTQSVEHAIAGALFVWPFIFDTAFTLLRRLVRGENVFRAHRSHLYQRLVASGWSHARVTLLYAALAAIGVCVGMLVV